MVTHRHRMWSNLTRSYCRQHKKTTAWQKKAEIWEKQSAQKEVANLLCIVWILCWLLNVLFQIKNRQCNENSRWRKEEVIKIMCFPIYSFCWCYVDCPCAVSQPKTSPKYWQVKTS
jgi:hypothetical protein